MKQTKVLVVDDDDVALTVVRAWLVAQGYDVLTHATPFGTLNLVRIVHPDVILLDVQMPALPGETLAELLRASKEGRSLKIIFFSGAPAERLAALTTELHADGWIKKTGDRMHFMEQFERLIRVDRGMDARSETRN